MNARGRTAVNFYVTAPYPCSYLPGNMARSQVVIGRVGAHDGLYDGLLQQGFRRSGASIYRPHCDQCQACVPVRLRVADFQPNRTQRRVWRRHEDIRVSLLKPEFDTAHFELYRRYQASRHAGGGMDNDDREQYTDFLLTSEVDTRLAVFHRHHALYMVSLIDVVVDGLSAVYTFFDPEAERDSPGVLNVLWQIDLARQLGVPYLYLGYWIAESRKMTYKQQYQPLEGLLGGEWREWSDISSQS